MWRCGLDSAARKRWDDADDYSLSGSDLTRIRSRLQTAIGHELNEAIWEELIEKQYIHDYACGRVLLEDVVDEYCHLRGLVRDASRSAHRTRSGHMPPPDNRWSAMRQVLKARAQGYPPVTRFRQENLAGGVIPWSQISDWVKDADSGDRSPLTFAIRIAPDRMHVGQDGSVTVRPPVVLPEIPSSLQPLSEELYWIDDQREIQSRLVRVAGLLDRLRRLALDVAHQFDLEHYWAVTFVLTGEFPPVHPVRISTRWPGNSHTYWRTRITLEVDPCLSPREVAEHYRRTRHTAGYRRDRPFSEKILELVGFVARNPEGTWEQKRREWNSEHPQWRYDEVDRFSRDYRRAVDRLFARPPVRWDHWAT